MSSYRSSYIPWQASLSSSNSSSCTASKQNSTPTDRYGGNNNKRYPQRSSSFGAQSFGSSSPSSTASPAPSTNSTPSYPSYRKNTPSILKKYANYASNNASAAAIAVAAAVANANASRKAANESHSPGGKNYAPEAVEGDSTAKNVSNIPRCRPFGSKFASPSPTGGPLRRRNDEIEEPPKTLFVSRATSPNPKRAGRRRGDDDNVLLSEMCKPKRRAGNHADAACQTEATTDSHRAPAPPSRTLASLSHKLLSGATSPGGGGGGSPGGRFSPKATSGGGCYSYARPTDLPIRSASLLRPAYRSSNDRLSPNADSAARDRLSPSFYHAFNSSLSSPSPPPQPPPLPLSPLWARTPSPLTVLRKSVTNLTLKDGGDCGQLGEPRDESDTDTDTPRDEDEDESSYEENYPTEKEKERYAYVGATPVVELTDKPPKYPPSPNALSKSKSIVRDVWSAENRAVALGNRSPSVSSISSGGGGKLDSGSGSGCDGDKQHIPGTNSCFDDDVGVRGSATENDSLAAPKSYAIRRIDSGEAPWWLASGSKSPDTADSSQQCGGFRLRKMDSADSPWWCKTSSNADSESMSESSRVPQRSSAAGGNSSSDNARPASASFGYTLRKMDSADVPWWCNSEQDSRASKGDDVSAGKRSSGEDANATCFQTRQFDSKNKDWWAESESSTADPSSTAGIPEWWNNVKSDDDECDGRVEAYKTSKVLRIKRIESVDKMENSEASASSHPEYSRIGDSRDYDDVDADVGRRTNVDSFYQDTSKLKYANELDNLLLYISDRTNIDELLGTEVPPPAAPVTPTGDGSSTEDELDEGCEKITAQQVKIHDGSAYTSTIHRRNGQLDDAALQLYKDGDYCSYLDLDSSINEQHDDFEGFQPSRKDSIVMRTQLSVRVHLIIEKLMNSEGRELRRALFSLKQIFQEDKDLVHEFVQNYGLDCLIKVGSDVDQNYQNYILRALGQVMLYVDGMNGVMEHNATIQWLYSLVSSKFRLVVKTALKLLLVFVEYVESNCLLLVQAVHALNMSQGTLPWSNITRLLHEYDATDTELLIYAMTLINKTLNGLTDQDTYYDQVDLLEEQDIESVIRKYMSKQGTDLDLLRQFQIYEAVLQHEDGEDECSPLKQLDETVRKTLRSRKSLTNGSANGSGGGDERRKSRRHSTGMTTLTCTIPVPPLTTLTRQYSETSSPDDYRIKSTTDGAGVTPGLRRRRERAERQRSLIREQYENNMRTMMDTSSGEDGLQNGNANYRIPQVYVNNTVNKLECMDDLSSSNLMRTHQNGEMVAALKREATVKDITQKLATLQTPADDSTKPQNIGRVEEMKGIISKAMEGLAKSQSRCDMLRSPTNECASNRGFGGSEVKKSETDLHWEELLATTTRSLHLCDLDFSDLKSDDEHDVLAPSCSANGVPPPPPPCCVPPPVPSVPKSVANKAKKTVKLFWKEVREDPIVMTKLNSKQLIWDEMFAVSVDTQRLEHLFESRAKDLISKKQNEMNKSKEIIVLDPKRSNAINIGMTKLPPPRSIKTAILKMDSTVMNREGIEKLLTMLPTEEERSKIQEAQVANPDLPLGTAEHFLLTLASISELTARLKLWSFKLNYENIEKEIAEPLMDLKQGMEVLRANKTFRAILSTLLSIGIFLNGTEVKGFQVEYLSKVPEVKDTVHKHSLLHHLCHIVMEKFPDSTDLYSEIGAVTRASRVDFDDLANSIERVKNECKASFDHLKAIAKHDGNTAMKLKLSDFLADCAERIIALGKVHRRLLNRFYKFCLWLGIPLHRIQSTKPNEICKIISEFALEYRTTRERVIQQLEKKANHRERNKTRGKMITEVGKFRSKEDRQDAELRQLLGKEHSPEYDSNTNNLHCGSLPWRRQRKDSAKHIRDQKLNGHLTDADDELLETLVKTATKTPVSRNATRERKRTRHSDRKSLRRTLKNGLTEEERTHLASYIKSY